MFFENIRFPPYCTVRPHMTCFRITQIRTIYICTYNVYGSYNAVSRNIRHIPRVIGGSTVHPRYYDNNWNGGLTVIPIQYRNSKLEPALRNQNFTLYTLWPTLTGVRCVLIDGMFSSRTRSSRTESKLTDTKTETQFEAAQNVNISSRDTFRNGDSYTWAYADGVSRRTFTMQCICVL